MAGLPTNQRDQLMLEVGVFVKIFGERLIAAHAFLLAA